MSDSLKKIKSFEEKMDFIDGEIAKRKSKWNLTALSWMDFDDVSQIIRAHVYKKWHLYDPQKALGPWLNRIISNQIKNLVRNNYGNFAKPCLKCAAAQGDNDCDIYKTQGETCPLYSEWTKTKKNAYDIKLAPSIESYKKEFVEARDSSSFDYDLNIANFNEKIKDYLKPFEYKIYKLLFIEKKSKEEVAQIMGYKTSENDRKPGYKHIKNIEKSIIAKSKKFLEEDRMDIYE